MTYARIRDGGHARWVIVDGSALREISAPPYLEHRETGRAFAPGGVRLLAPAEPRSVFALAWNYADHLHGRDRPGEPQVFLKLPSNVIGPEEEILLPAGAGRVDEEAELVAVIGRRCQGVQPRDAMEYVFGYTCGNDVSARVWQKNDMSWWRAKASDTFAPLGPYLVTAGRPGFDPARAEIVGKVNGREVQRCAAADMFFDVSRLVSWISAAVTLEPGDLIFTGTSGSPAELHGGDVVEIEIPGIGVLRNPVRAL